MKFKRIAIRCVALIWFFFIFIVYYITFFNRFTYIFPKQMKPLADLINSATGFIERILPF